MLKIAAQKHPQYSVHEYLQTHSHRHTPFQTLIRSDIHKCTHTHICIPSEHESERLGMPKNTSAPTIALFQPSESSAVKLFVIKFSVKVLPKVVQSGLGAHIQLIALSVEFLIYSNACSRCGTETKGLLYPRQKRLRDLERFAHCLACHGWLDYCPRLDELSADTMYVSDWVAPDPTDSLNV